MEIIKGGVTAANGFCLDEPESVRNMRLLEMLREQKRQAEAMGVRLVVSAKTGDESGTDAFGCSADN